MVGDKQGWADNILNVKIELVSKPKSYGPLRNIHLNKEQEIITNMAKLIYNDKDYKLEEKSILGMFKGCKMKKWQFMA